MVSTGGTARTGATRPQRHLLRRREPTMAHSGGTGRTGPRSPRPARSHASSRSGPKAPELPLARLIAAAAAAAASAMTRSLLPGAVRASPSPPPCRYALLAAVLVLD